MYALNSYRQVQNETASKERTLVLLFEAAQRFMVGGAKSLDEHKVPQALQSLGKASDIVTELWGTLDHTKSPELCHTLEQIYEYVALELTKALTRKDPAHARNAERVFAPLVDAFRQAVAQVTAR